MIAINGHCHSYGSDHDESCDEAPVSFELSGYQESSHLSPSQVDHVAQRSKRCVETMCGVHLLELYQQCYIIG